MRLTIVAGICVAFSSFSARAADVISIVENGLHKTIACEGRDLTLAGNEADLKLTGECGRIDVMGNSNKVSAETASKLAVSGNQNEVSIGTAKRIDVTGNRNHVTWESEVDGKAPKISNPGTKNTVARASGSGTAPTAAASDDDDEGDEEDDHPTTVAGALDQAQAALNAAGVVGSVSDGSSMLINDVNLEKTYACDGKDIAVNGTDNKLTLTGECHHVAVNGSNNVVHIEAARQITASGTDNKVYWKRGTGKGDPKVANLGVHNKVSREK